MIRRKKSAASNLSAEALAKADTPCAAVAISVWFTLDPPSAAGFRERVMQHKVALGKSAAADGDHKRHGNQ